ncbi:hypothetical protein [Lysobacter sp. Hz 25]|uniref:hypothetical protein n=1 Tax=Lysobacter sp. Hz 25 TaxID=3383698 RepID=UPI0038D46903
MGARKRRYVGKPVPADGWRVWDGKSKRGWGNVYADYSAAVPDELNGEGSPQRPTELGRRSRAPKAKAVRKQR